MSVSERNYYYITDMVIAMSIHGDFVQDDTKWIRYEEGSSKVVYVHESLYAALKPVYDYIKEIVEGVLSEVFTDHISKFVDVIQFIAENLDYSISIVSGILITVVVKLAETSVNMKKFMYKGVGKIGETKLGESPVGGGTKVLELPS